MKRLAIFDLDGTLVNTIEDLAASANYALSQLGFPIHEPSVCATFVGNGIAKLMERALPEGHKDRETLKSALEMFIMHYDAHCTDASRPYPGICTLLREMQDGGIKIAVASNKYHSATSKIICSLFPDIRFSSVLGNRDDIPRKPDPTIVYNVMAESGISDKSDILYIGDSGTDMETAINAGVDSCAVTWGFRSVEELRSFSPKHIISSPDEILRFI